MGCPMQIDASVVPPTSRTELPNETQNQRLNPRHVLVPFTLPDAFTHEERSTVHHQRHTPKYANEPNVVNLIMTLLTTATTNSTMECKDGRRTILQQRKKRMSSTGKESYATTKDTRCRGGLSMIMLNTLRFACQSAVNYPLPSFVL